MPEVRRKRFLKIATLRTNRILEDLTRLSRCSNKSHYEFNDAEIKKILAALDVGIASLKVSFSKDTKKQNFSLL